MEIVLGPLEARVIGCLIEKEICTPDQYPLSLNALVNACNQKSNREPVLELAELDIRAVIDELIRRRLVVNTAGFNARVPRYQHRFCNTEFGELKFSAQELGIICELLLRGPQTPGELRSRTNRLCSFDDVTEVDAVLATLIERGPMWSSCPVSRASGNPATRTCSVARWICRRWPTQRPLATLCHRRQPGLAGSSGIQLGKHDDRKCEKLAAGQLPYARSEAFTKASCGILLPV